MKLGKFKKTDTDRTRFFVDYALWLTGSEVLDGYSFETSSLVVDAAELSDDFKGVTFFVSGGVNGTTETLSITVSTTDGQVREDYLIFSVVNPP